MMQNPPQKCGGFFFLRGFKCFYGSIMLISEGFLACDYEHDEAYDEKQAYSYDQ